MLCNVINALQKDNASLGGLIANLKQNEKTRALLGGILINNHFLQPKGKCSWTSATGLNYKGCRDSEIKLLGPQSPLHQDQGQSETQRGELHQCPQELWNQRSPAPSESSKVALFFLLIASIPHLLRDNTKAGLCFTEQHAPHSGFTSTFSAGSNQSFRSSHYIVRPGK